MKRIVFERDCFVHNGSFYAARLKVWSDGVIDCWGHWDKAGFLEQVNKGWITVDIPEGITKLRICNQDFDIKQSVTKKPDGNVMFEHKWITQEDFIKEVLDAVHVANGNESICKKCYNAYVKYKENPSDENKKTLRYCYNEVPKHKRIFVLGNQDLKDLPIKDILGE